MGGGRFALRARFLPPWNHMHLTAWVSISRVGPHHYDIPTFTEFYCVGSILCMGDLFAPRALSPPTCTYIHYMGFNSLHGSPPLLCTYIHHMGSIPCVGDLFALMTLSLPPFLHSLHPCIYHVLHPLCTMSTAYCMRLCTVWGSILLHDLLVVMVVTFLH